MIIEADQANIDEIIRNLHKYTENARQIGTGMDGQVTTNFEFLKTEDGRCAVGTLNVNPTTFVINEAPLNGSDSSSDTMMMFYMMGFFILVVVFLVLLVTYVSYRVLKALDRKSNQQSAKFGPSSPHVRNENYYLTGNVSLYPNRITVQVPTAGRIVEKETSEKAHSTDSSPGIEKVRNRSSSRDIVHQMLCSEEDKGFPRAILPEKSHHTEIRSKNNHHTNNNMSVSNREQGSEVTNTMKEQSRMDLLSRRPGMVGCSNQTNGDSRLKESSRTNQKVI